MAKVRWVNVKVSKAPTGRPCVHCGKGSRSYVVADRLRAGKRMQVAMCHQHAEQAGIDHG